MQRQRHRERRSKPTTRRRTSSSSTSSSLRQQQIRTAVSWTGHHELDDSEDEPLGVGMKLQDLRLKGSPKAINMVYQYVFEEGLELSLVPEHEASPFASGPKVLELGLTGFTGRLIITQQAFRQYALSSARNEEKKDASVVSSSSSSESESRQPQHPQAKQTSAAKSRPHSGQGEMPDSARRREKDTAASSKRTIGKAGLSTAKATTTVPPRSKKGARSVRPPAPPDAIDDLAAVFLSSEASKPLPTNVAHTSVDSFSNSVEVVSVASSVSTGAAAVRAKREDALDQFAFMFAAPSAPQEAADEEDIDESSVGLVRHQGGWVASDQQGLSRGQGSMGGNKASGGEGSTADDPISEFATAFVALSGPSAAAADGGGSIDEDTSLAAASRAASTTGSGSDVASNASSVQPTPVEDPLSDFAAAFVALSGPTPGPEVQGGSIDDDKSSDASAVVSQESSQSVTTRSMDEQMADDLISDFTTAFVALSGPPTVPEVALGSIDEESAVTSIQSASESASASAPSASLSFESGKVPQAEEPPKQEQSLDPLNEFIAAFGELSGPAGPDKPASEMIDEESVPSIANSSSLSSSSSAGGSQPSSKADGAQGSQEPPDAMTDFVSAFGALTVPPAQDANKGQMIDEESPSSAPSSSSTTTAPQSSASLSSSEDPLTQFTKAHIAESPGPAGVGRPRSIQAPQAPSGKVSPEAANRELAQPQQRETKAGTGQGKRRASQKSKTRKAATAGSGKPKISMEKKRKIREMFPNYPDVSTGSQGSLDPVGVYLHQKCSAPYEKTLAPKDLRELLEVFPFAAYCADDKGRLPLHVLGENARLVRDPQGRQRATSLARLLIQAYPQSVTYPDSDGRLPFVALLQQWIEVHYEQMSEKYSRDSRLSSAVKKSFMAVQGKQGVGSQEERPIQYDKLFPSIELWPYAEWCLSMLSMVLDDMVGKGILQEAMANRSLREQMEARSQYVANVILSVPYLLKSVLFIDGGVGSTRKRILQMSFIRRAFLSSQSVGTWLEGMVLKQGTPSKLAIDYFQLLSHTTAVDYVGPKRSPDQNDVDAFHRERETVYQAIEKMEVIIPSLVVLNEKETERAATTNVVWYIMNRSLSQPFVVGLLLIDFTLHLTLMLSFRNSVNLPQTTDSFLARTPPNLVPVICSHYIIRKACEALSFLVISKKAFLDYFVSMWNVFDTLTHILTLVADSLQKESPETYVVVLNATVLALLWIKVLGFLKFANKEMATFILALIQIFIDIRFFMVVFFVVIFMFADMIHVILTTSDEGYCDTSEGDLPASTQDFCSTWSIDYYFRMYAVLLGEFELAEYQQTPAIRVLFFLFTISGVIILLNVLIAVISDSYNNSKESSLLLFGRARVGFVAEMIALESFLRPGRNPLKIVQTKLQGTPIFGNAQVLSTWRCTSIVIRWLVVLSLLGSALTADIFLLSEMTGHYGNFLFFFLYLFFALILLVAIWVVSIFVFGDFLRCIFRGVFRPCMRVADHWANLFTYVVTVKVFALNSDASSRDVALLDSKEDAGDDMADASEERKELMEKIFIMEKSMRQAIHETKSQLTKRMDATAARLINEERKERAQLMKKLSKLIERLDSDERTVKQDNI